MKMTHIEKKYGELETNNTARGYTSNITSQRTVRAYVTPPVMRARPRAPHLRLPDAGRDILIGGSVYPSRVIPSNLAPSPFD